MSDTSIIKATSSRKEWRKLVKKLRRKKIRQKRAKEEQLECNQTDKDETEAMSDIDEDARIIRYQQWLKNEEEAQQLWQIKEAAQKKQEEERRNAQEKIRKEWEEARRKKLEKQMKDEEKQNELHRKIELYISGAGKVPVELQVYSESNPSRELCPFFSKVSACRFGQACSRNHKIPAISKIILISNFYTHFTLNQSRAAEYDTDLGLEFDEREKHLHFLEFFDDVVSELEKYGDIQVVQVCKNHEAHLRGNVYVEYREERFALKAVRSLNARWYGGRQLTVSLANIPNWHAAVCGDFIRSRCPKGDDCNFLHPFKNPRSTYVVRRLEEENVSRGWRWSESPEKTISNRIENINVDRSNKRHASKRRHRRSSYYDDGRYYKRRSEERRNTENRSEKKSRKAHRTTTSCKTRHLSPHNRSE